MAGEVWFYHLERSSLEEILPDLLARSLARGWRALVVAPDRRRLEALDERLWTFGDESFLPHGLEGEPHAARHPVLLSVSGENLNQADVLILIDGADAGDVAPYERSILVFDGTDEAALSAARERWTGFKKAGLEVAYWRQKEAGGWERQA
ncbi:MAG TPA: DNA polymerase III subunit chi [Caulobacteraceae bacterium]|nr:DNA polymerase III subunit chi [Caulobacteraceae bacterium]